MVVWRRLFAINISNPAATRHWLLAQSPMLVAKRYTHHDCQICLMIHTKQLRYIYELPTIIRTTLFLDRMGRVSYHMWSIPSIPAAANIRRFAFAFAVNVTEISVQHSVIAI